MDIFKPFDLPLKILSIYGKTIEENFKLKNFLIALLTHIIFVDIFLIFQLLYLMEISSIRDFMEFLSLFSTHLCYVAKLTNLLVNYRGYIEIIALLRENIKTYEINGKFIKRIDKVNLFFRIIFFSALISSSCGGFASYFTHELAFKMWFPSMNSTTLNPGFLSVAIYQHIDGIWLSGTDVTFDFIPVFLMVYVVAMLEQLCEKLEMMREKQLKGFPKKKNSVFNLQSELISIELQRLKIIEIVRKIEKSFNFAFFARGFTTSFVICTSMFALSSITDAADLIKRLIFVLGTPTTLFFPCYFGNEISVVSDRLTTSLFHTDWHINDDREYKKLVLMFMQLSKEKIKIHSAKIFQLDLGTFLKVCNAAYSLYAVFKHIN